MSPKSLLRHPKVVSAWKEFTQGQFIEVMPDPKNLDVKGTETLVLCSGKLYYDLDEGREKTYTDAKGITILRVEQLYPFPRTQLTPFLSAMPKLSRVIWAQEEPMNMGAFSYIRPKLEDLFDEVGKKKIRVEYAGRTERASPAVGSTYQHQKEQKAILEKVFKG
jgi:2-oxoglutarate dehydrogenase E1 component